MIQKREELSQFDTKTKAYLGSQIILKIEDFKKRKGKGQKIADFYHKGICFIDFLKAEKELNDILEKEKIKNDIQSRKAKHGTARKMSRTPVNSSGFSSHRGSKNEKPKNPIYLTKNLAR